MTLPPSRSWRSRVADVLPGMRSQRRLRRIEATLDRVKHFTLGANATYVGDNRVLVRTVAGHHAFVFFVHADDKLLSPWFITTGLHEPELTRYLVSASSPDSHCIDVGANFGYFSCLMAKHCPQGRVIGIEPDPAVHAIAVDNLLVNTLHHHAEILNAAAADTAGTLTLYRRVGRSGNTSIAAAGGAATDAYREPPEQPFDIAALRIDDLLPRLGGRVDFIKIDIEGAEPLAFAGAAETIAANPQLRLVMEWSPGQVRSAGFDLAGFVDAIAASGLAAHVIEGDGPRRIEHADLLTLDYQPGVLLARNE